MTGHPVSQGVREAMTTVWAAGRYSRVLDKLQLIAPVIITNILMYFEKVIINYVNHK